MSTEHMDCPRSCHYLPVVAYSMRNQILLTSFDRDALSSNQQSVATLHHDHVFIEFMYVLGGSCGLAARPKCHLALIGSVEDVPFDTGSCLIRLSDSVRGILHELRKGVHAGAYYRKKQRPFISVLSDEEPILRICDVHTTRALLVVSYVVDATADEVAAHEAGMIGL